MDLTPQQQIQEDQYVLPYHWFWRPENYVSRFYFGILSLSRDVIDRLSFKQPKILDVGCGDGRFLGFLREAGYQNLFGIDFSAAAINFARLFVPTARFFVGELAAQTDLPKNFFDIIVLMDVLEHVPPEKIGALIATLPEYLNSAGVLVISVPTVNWPRSPKHYQHFTVETLTTALAPLFVPQQIIGQDIRPSILARWLYKLLDNRFYILKNLAAAYNKKI